MIKRELDAGDSGQGFTDDERRRIQETLDAALDPNQIRQRAGPKGARLDYIAAGDQVGTANTIFGFNGWSCRVTMLETDFRRFDQQSSMYKVGITAIVRVTLRDGSFHEDVGYGEGINRNEAAALEKSKKQAVTDARKRALRLFGEQLGTSINDREKIEALRKAPPRTDSGVSLLNGHNGGGSSRQPSAAAAAAAAEAAAAVAAAGMDGTFDFVPGPEHLPPPRMQAGAAAAAAAGAELPLSGGSGGSNGGGGSSGASSGGGGQQQLPQHRQGPIQNIGQPQKLQQQQLVAPANAGTAMAQRQQPRGQQQGQPPRWQQGQAAPPEAMPQVKPQGAGQHQQQQQQQRRQSFPAAPHPQQQNLHPEGQPRQQCRLSLPLPAQQLQQRAQPQQHRPAAAVHLPQQQQPPPLQKPPAAASSAAPAAVPEFDYDAAIAGGYQAAVAMLEATGSSAPCGADGGGGCGGGEDGVDEFGCSELEPAFLNACADAAAAATAGAAGGGGGGGGDYESASKRPRT